MAWLFFFFSKGPVTIIEKQILTKTKRNQKTSQCRTRHTEMGHFHTGRFLLPSMGNTNIAVKERKRDIEKTVNYNGV